MPDERNVVTSLLRLWMAKELSLYFRFQTCPYPFFSINKVCLCFLWKCILYFSRPYIGHVFCLRAILYLIFHIDQVRTNFEEHPTRNTLHFHTTNWPARFNIIGIGRCIMLWLCCHLDLTRFNKIAIQARAQMAADKEAVGLSRVLTYELI